MRLFETSTLTLLKAFHTERNINSASISPLASCPYMIAGGGQDAMSVTTTAAKQGRFECSFFDHVFDDELGSVAGHFGPINTLAYAPHGQSYVSGGEDGYIRIHHFEQVTRAPSFHLALFSLRAPARPLADASTARAHSPACDAPRAGLL